LVVVNKNKRAEMAAKTSQHTVTAQMCGSFLGIGVPLGSPAVYPNRGIKATAPKARQTIAASHSFRSHEGSTSRHAMPSNHRRPSALNAGTHPVPLNHHIRSAE
jgi:hypothetical protein